MRNDPERSIRLTNDPAYSVAVGGYESLQRETQNRQQLMSNPIAPDMETYLVSTQKSAEGIVLSILRKEGSNVEKRMTLS
jgi:hypothetical protein